MSCNECNLTVHLMKDLHSLLSSATDLGTLTSSDEERLTFVLEESEAHLSKYIGHRIRTIHQNAAPGREMASMGCTEAFIIEDYMNKWLHLTTTSDAFGQAGESVHGATVYVRVLPEEVKQVIASREVEDVGKYLRELPVDTAGDIHRWYVLLGSSNDHKQDAWHALSVTEATLTIVKELEPQVESVRLRFDNATCYHGTMFWLLVSIMEEATGIKVTEVGMNEAGEGKDETDSSFNTAKAYVRRLVNVGRIDARTAVEFIAALNTGEGIVGMVARVVEIFRPPTPLEIGTLDQITRFSHFRHEEEGLRCWEQYDIGPGRFFTNVDLRKLFKEDLPGVQISASDDAPNPEAKIKARTAPQQKTELQLTMLETAFQKGLEKGGGRSSRESDQDVLNSINAVSAPQKQLRLEQVSSWFSRRYSKYVLEAKNARVNAEVQLARANQAALLVAARSIVDEMLEQGKEHGLAEVVTTGPTAQAKKAAAESALATKRKAMFDLGKDHFIELQGIPVAQHNIHVKKLKVDPVRGLLMFFKEMNEIPTGKKAECISAVLMHVDKMLPPDVVSAPNVAADVNIQAVDGETSTFASQSDDAANFNEPMEEDDSVEISLSEDDQGALVASFLKQFRVA
ncbi:hypothetical protein CYMTET_55500 [Cymbomonas tetramitiformis]|uniref:Uncharacterized protein n=1 Tax=Cymbomonas tetramitiformis TaxID=36881 RepID=A0AAE0BE14_9CHLO|nr:hypothetical protein CYMTET_55500 [Cymbomonas tetramitiformis]